MKLAHFGTFDIQNYGDLLFPLVAEYHLRDTFDEFVHISPIGGSIYEDVPESTTLESVIGEGTQFDAVLVGGGNIVHARPSGLVEYNTVRRTAYPDLWAGAARLAATQSIPLAFNAPGVPRRVKPPTSYLMKRATNQANYLSVRDDYSADYLKAIGVSPEVVPDSALSISTVLGPRETLIETVPSFVRELDRSAYVAVHVNDRYAGAGILETALLLDRLSSLMSARVCLIAIGPCHGDDVYARNIAELMQSNPVVFDRPPSVSSIAWVIAGAEAYVGSSLHGFITATSYGIPPILVANHAAQHKFSGLLAHLSENNDRMFESWASVVADLSQEGVSKSLMARTPDTAQATQRLDRHWNSIRQALRAPVKTSSPLMRTQYAGDLVAAANFIEDGLKDGVRRRIPSRRPR
jgi:polysaccharide pyruvyl transferase WcaK-like protein